MTSPGPAAVLRADLGARSPARRSSARPLGLPALAGTLAVLGVLGIALVGAGAPNDHSLKVRLPLDFLPPLAPGASTLLIVGAISAQALGLAGMLTALHRGWRPDPRRLFAAGAAGVLLCSSLTPTGSADVGSYAAYGRLAALGLDPYRATPADLGGGYAHLVSSSWLHTPSVYGPVATWIQQAAATLGGDRPWLTVWLLMLANGAAFLAVGALLVHAAGERRSLAAVLWVANPLLIGQLGGGGHLDTFVAGFAVAAVVCARRGETAGGRLSDRFGARLGGRQADLAAGALVGLACGVKVSAALVGAGLLLPLLHRRAWSRALVQAGAAAGVFLLLYATCGLHALAQLHDASRLISSPSLWQAVRDLATPLAGTGVVQTVTSLGWPLLTLAFAWQLRRALPADAPPTVAVPVVLTLAWVLAAPWTMPWYSAVGWAGLALLPRSALTWWFPAVTTVLAFAHNTNGGTWAW